MSCGRFHEGTIKLHTSAIQSQLDHNFELALEAKLYNITAAVEGWRSAAVSALAAKAKPAGMWREKLVQPRCTVPINIELPNIFKRVKAGDIRIVTRLDRLVNSTRGQKLYAGAPATLRVASIE